MSISEKDAVLRERAAFERGVTVMHLQPEVPGGEVVGRAAERALDEVAKRYPLPKVTRPRVVPDPLGGGISWRAVDGNVEWSGDASCNGATWMRYPDVHPAGWVKAIYPTTQRLAVMLDLLANPTEEVEAES